MCNSMLEARVSNIELYRIWKGMEGVDPGWLVNRLTKEEPSEKMLKGTAFHKALELASESDSCTIRALGYTFNMLCDVDIALPTVREVTLSKMYGDLRVNGTLDGLSGKTVIDYKTTEQFDGERYMESLQWRFYLDLSNADRFDYHAFQMKECGDKAYDVYGYHKLTQYRYTDLHDDCDKAANEYCRFATAFLVPAVA